MLAKHPEKHLLIDRLTLLQRKPSAAPLLLPEEVIAVVLNFIEWPRDREIHSDDVVVKEIIHGLKLAGHSIVPTEAKREE